MAALLLHALAFLLGVAVVIWCVELFIEAVARSTVTLGISGFFLAVVLAGVDVENAVLGVTAAAVALPDLALGTVFGEAMFVLAVAVGLAGVLVPFETTVPRRYLAMMVLVPVPAFALSLRGTIGAPAGAALLAVFAPLLWLIYRRERRAETAYLRAGEVESRLDAEPGHTPTGSQAVGGPPPGEDGDAPPGGEGGDGASAVGTGDRPSAATDDRGGPSTATDDRDGPAAAPDDGDGAGPEGRRETGASGRLPELDLDEYVPDLEDASGGLALAAAVAAVGGMTFGSLVTVRSAEGLFVAAGITELAFGATVLSFVASIEELALTIEPVRRGRPHLAVGNVVGSTVFYATANVGLVALVAPVHTGGAVMAVHWPFFAVALGIVAATLARGRVTRSVGGLLLAVYLGYWVAAYAY